MFSRLLYPSAASLFSYNALSESVSSLQVDKQIQTELEQAAEQGMVSTRSQDNTPAGDASQPSKLLYPQVVVWEKKRKSDIEGEESPAQTVTKKRRRSAKSNEDATPSSNASKPGSPRRKASAKAVHGDAAHAIDQNESDQKPSTPGSRPNPSQTPGITTAQTIDDDKKGEAIKVAINTHDHKLRLDDEVSEAHDQVKPDAGSATRSRKGKTSKKGRRDAEGSVGEDENGAADISIPGKKPETPFATAVKATHKRFGSEDIEVPGPVTSSGIEERERGQQYLSEDDGDSEDEGPETVTASAGFEKARTSALDAARVVARQEADKKLRRKEHDQRLRLQAKSAKDSRSEGKPSGKVRGTKGSLPEIISKDRQTSVEKPKSLGESPQITNGEGRIPKAKPKSSGKISLPLLLPEEILAAEPVVHAPKLPLSSTKLATSQKRKFLDPEPKPPKDIKRGNLNIRVLQDNQSILPPKSSQASKALRESWLTGRRGFKGEIAVQRRKPSGGFVRKKG